VVTETPTGHPQQPHRQTADGTPPTLAEFVDSRLRSAILAGDLAPGSRLRAEHLADAWGVSPTPVREAFQRLAGEGIVLIEAQRGARVAPVDPAAAAELYELRLTLEPLALRSAMATAADDEMLGDRYRSAVLASHGVLAAPHRSVSDYLSSHRTFHLALLEGCSNRRLHRLTVQLHDHTQRFQIAGAGYERRGDAAAEHRQLCDAVVAGDVNTACDVVAAHLLATLDAVQALVDVQQL
jgi:GntR family transcriptional regulator, carbon starvation induced regulator